MRTIGEPRWSARLTGLPSGVDCPPSSGARCPSGRPGARTPEAAGGGAMVAMRGSLFSKRRAGRLVAGGGEAALPQVDDLFAAVRVQHLQGGDEAVVTLDDPDLL